MTQLTCNVLEKLAGKTLVTAESCTGGGIGAALTAVPGSSEVYKGGIISYTNEVKQKLLGINPFLLKNLGAVSAPIAEAMAIGARNALSADIAVSVTGLAGPGGDDKGNPVGLVFVGYADDKRITSRRFVFSGDREEVRAQAVEAALKLILELIWYIFIRLAFKRHVVVLAGYQQEVAVLLHAALNQYALVDEHL